MSDTQRLSKSSGTHDLGRIAIVIGFGLPIAVVVASVSDVGKAILFGWFFFLDRNLATFQPDGPTFWVGVAAFAILFVAVHRLARRTTSDVFRNSSPTHQCWTWRSTTAICMGVLILFAASVSIVASLHQLIWLASGSQSTKSHSAKWSRPDGSFSGIFRWQRESWRTGSRNNIRMIMLGLHNYESTYGTFPLGAIMLLDGRGYRGWVPPLGPFISFSDEWGRYPQCTWDDPLVAELGKGGIPDLLHPELGWRGQFDKRHFALMHYAGNVHVFPNNVAMKLSEVTDGTSTTLAVGEVAENFQAWASPWNRRDPSDGINDVPWGFGGPPWQHGAQFGMMDGSVRLLSRNIDRKVLKALGTPAGGEQIEEDAAK